MGTCGCGEFVPHKTVKIGDLILVLEIYPGCELCETGIVVSLHIFTQEGAKEWGLRPDQNFKPDKYGWSQLDFPLIGSDELVKASWDIEKAEGNLLGKNGYDNLPDLLTDKGLELLQRGLRHKLAEHK